MIDDRITFLYQSIQDNQATIRGLDVKAGFIFLIVVQPILNINSILCFYKSMQANYAFNLFSIILCSIWMLSLILLFKTVMPLNGSLKNIKEDDSSPDCFYGGGLFKLTTIDLLLNTTCLSKYSKYEFLKKMQSASLESILLSEKLKLCYIRDVKAKRIFYCIACVFMWIVLGLAMYILWR